MDGPTFTKHDNTFSLCDSQGRLTHATPVEGGAGSGRLNAVGDARHANDLTAKPDEESPTFKGAAGAEVTPAGIGADVPTVSRELAGAAVDATGVFVVPCDPTTTMMPMMTAHPERLVPPAASRPVLSVLSRTVMDCGRR
jgi:hypothetical protein